jgi:hypothetical protein
MTNNKFTKKDIEEIKDLISKIDFELSEDGEKKRFEISSNKLSMADKELLNKVMNQSIEHQELIEQLSKEEINNSQLAYSLFILETELSKTKNT